jgi:hypothetical protein
LSSEHPQRIFRGVYVDCLASPGNLWLVLAFQIRTRLRIHNNIVNHTGLIVFSATTDQLVGDVLVQTLSADVVPGHAGGTSDVVFVYEPFIIGG